MTTEEFRLTLARCGLSQGSFARLLTYLGDPASPTTVLRRVERWAQGGHKIPGEIIAFLAVMERFPKVAATLTAEAKAAADAEAAAVAHG